MSMTMKKHTRGIFQAVHLVMDVVGAALCLRWGRIFTAEDATVVCVVVCSGALYGPWHNGR